MAETPFLKSIGRYKGNRVLLEGVALARSRGTDVRLTLVERVGGGEASGVRTMIKELGIGEATTWVSGDSQNGLGHVEMAQRYMESDVVADDFGAGWFGGVAIEGAACGRPVMNAVDDDVMHNLYPDHPFLTANSGEEVCMRLESLRDGDYRRQVGEQSARWALEHHGRRNVAERCLRMLERVVS
jgi:glycosyltransferase involved in cell wall biosynthesis